MLLYCLDDDAEDVSHSTNIFEGDRKKYVKMLENFNQFSQVWKNVIIKRADLILSTSKKAETSNQYITALYCLVETWSQGRND